MHARLGGRRVRVWNRWMRVDYARMMRSNFCVRHKPAFEKLSGCSAGAVPWRSRLDLTC